jgi:hypothetical protein
MSSTVEQPAIGASPDVAHPIDQAASGGMGSVTAVKVVDAERTQGGETQQVVARAFS